MISLFQKSPYCEQFLSDTLWPTFQDLGTEVMNVTVIPFGNARVDEQAQTIACQHGVAECDANTYELCAIEMVKHVEDYLPFLVCNAKSLPAGHKDDPFPASMFQECADQSGLWFEALQACHDSETMAWEVNWKAYQATPTHPYVPYVLVAGSELADGADFETEICRLYTAQGGKHPKCDEEKKGSASSLSLNDELISSAKDIVCLNE